MRFTRLSMLSVGVVATLALAACGGSSDSGSSSSAAATSESAAASSEAAPAGGPITVAAFNFGESKILAQMYAAVLEKAGYEPEVKELTNREVVQPALQGGEVQVVPEYAATLTDFLNAAANGPDAPSQASGDLDTTMTALRALAEPVGVTVLDASPAADQNAFAVTAEFADANGLTTLSDLATWSQSNDLVLGGPPECVERPFCQPGLEETYGMVFSDFKSLDAGGPLTKQALSQGQIGVGLVFSSDGGVAALDLAVLEDDKQLQKTDNIVPAVNSAVVTQELTDALNAVSAALTTDDLIELNKAVDIDRKDPKDVAVEWLTAQGLL
ncbi:MAG: ABC transporter substrate-binding protein [Candidatus Nanopelagicales bacterium]